jgi:hypothetical protein
MTPGVEIDSPRARRALLTATAVLAVLLCCLAGASTVAARYALASKRIRYARVSSACSAPKPGDATCFALVRVPVSSSAAGEAGVMRYVEGDGAREFGPAGGLTPADLAGAYGYSPAAGGEGQTVAIVDPFDDPSIESDLEQFDEHYRIASCTTANGCFEKVSQTGSMTTLPTPAPEGWSIEISLDVETAHAVCPRCKILLVEAQSPSFTNLAAAVNEAVTLGATEVSNSYGGPEVDLGASRQAAYAHPGVVIAAATGDDGYDDWAAYVNGTAGEPGTAREPAQRPNMPAALPSVVAVGGTTLELEEDGARESETVWNGDGSRDESFFVFGQPEGATGGGCSNFFTAQPWQRNAPGFAATGCGERRLAADVAAVADPLTGFDIYDTYATRAGREWMTAGGTSLSTPLISSLYALAGGSNGVSYPSLTLYGHLGDPSDRYDVTEGGNGFCDDDGLACGADADYGATIDCEGTTACNAAPGYDGPSGVGTPTSLGLFRPLFPQAVIVPPGSLVAGRTSSFSGEASSDPYAGGSIAGYSWNWGDGTPDGSDVASMHSYTSPGEYTVALTVTDSYGLSSAAATRSVVVGMSSAEIQAREAAANQKREEEAAARSAVIGFHSSRRPIPDAKLANVSLHVSAAGVVRLRVSCPTVESICSGKVALRTLGAIVARNQQVAHKRSVLTLATGWFDVSGGHVRTVTLRLSAIARALLLRVRKLRARATLSAHDARGTTYTSSATVTLLAPKEPGRTG